MKKIKEKSDDCIYVNSDEGIELIDYYVECDTEAEAQMILDNIDEGNAFLEGGERPYSTKQSVQIIKYNGKWYVPLYNVAGMDAIELKLTNGRVFRIGTDEPDQLLQAIQSQLK